MNKKLNVLLKKTGIILTLVLIIINIYVISNYSEEIRRIIRLISTGCFFIAFLYHKGYRYKTILYGFSLLFIVDFLDLFYEQMIFSKLVSILKIGAFFFFAASISSKLKLFEVKKGLLAFFVFLIIYNVISAVDLIWSTLMNKTNDILESIIFALNTIVTIIMVIVSVNYNFRYNTKKSMYFLYFIFGLILSDTSWFIAYFLHYKLAFNFDILFYCFALFFIIRYIIFTNEEKDSLIEDAI